MLFPLWYLVTIAYAMTVNGEQVNFDIQESLTPSLMDKLYGDLVQTPETELNKLKLLKSGKVKQDESQLIAADDYSASAVDDYYKYQSKINFPDKDDTTDINFDQTFFGGILTFAHTPHFNCFDPKNENESIDIAIVGAPFDTGVSYRPGARFGPEAIRSSLRRIGGLNQENKSRKKKKNYPTNPWDTETHNLSIIDCGDVNMNPFDNRIALNQLYRGQRAIQKHTGNKFKVPKVVTMGGDHTITLMALKSIHEQLGKPINIIHFDSHIDTWDPKVLGGGLTSYMELNHGTFLHFASELGYIKPENNFHVGIRAPFIDDLYDEKHDLDCGFNIISARDLDKIGVEGIIKKLKAIGKDNPTYISVDIDCLDPAFAPGTGTVEVGGFSSRELLTIIDGLAGMNIVGGDVVEVSPPYDTNSEVTSLAATFVIESLVKLMM